VVVFMGSMTNKPQFKGAEEVINYDYGKITGDVADEIQKSLLEAKVAGTDISLADAGFAIRGKSGVDSGVLWGSTPDIVMALWHYVPTKDFGFLPATPQQWAKIFNTNPQFIKGKLLGDIQMIRNGFATESNGVWADTLNRELANLGYDKESVLAVSYQAVKPVFINVANGHLSQQKLAGYTLTEKAKELIKVIDWKEKCLKGFCYNKFDEERGVPVPDSGGSYKFYGLTSKTFSALFVSGDLGAGGYRVFDDSGEGPRVVGWRTGEASSR